MLCDAFAGECHISIEVSVEPLGVSSASCGASLWAQLVALFGPLWQRRIDGGLTVASGVGLNFEQLKVNRFIPLAPPGDWKGATLA